MKREALKTGWLQPQAVYGYFPCQAEGMTSSSTPLREREQG